MKIIKKTLNTILDFAAKLTADNVPAYSAYVSFFLFISAFPFIMVLLTFIKYTPLTKDILFSFIGNIAPGIIGDTLVSWVEEIYNSHSAIMSVSILLALWSSSKGILGITHSINNIYGCTSRKNYFFKRILAMFYTLILLIIIMAALALLLFGNRIVAWVGITSIISDFRIVIALAMFFFIFIILYAYVPNRKTKIRYELPGAVFTTAGWILFTHLYSIYLNHVDIGNSIYGSLATIILLLMWMYICMYILFVGAEINVLYSKLRD